MKPKNILLIDDDEDDQALFVDALNQIDNSFRCDIASSGSEAMHSLNTKSPTPDIIFLDLNMPKMNGYECLAEIKKEEKFKHIPIVIYSTVTVQSENQRTQLMEAEHLLTKPNDFTVLVKELSSILDSELK
jgi:CheY-like chemotaxis protein